MRDAPTFNIAGKDWFTEPEAAFYCGVSLRKFQTDAPFLGIRPRRFMGKKLYSKNELFDLIEKSQPWHREPVFTSAVRVAQSPDMRAILDRFTARPLRPFKPRKKKS